MKAKIWEEEDYVRERLTFIRRLVSGKRSCHYPNQDNPFTEPIQKRLNEEVKGSQTS